MFRSRFFTMLISVEGQAALTKCLTSDAHHVTLGASGCHVQHIQIALKRVMPSIAVGISRSEIESRTYGKSTAAAVLAYKHANRIINPAYQKTPDAIVGKMTIAHLDASLAAMGW